MSTATDRFGRRLPLPGHFTDCPHGLDGRSFCTCPDRRRPAGGSTERWPEHPAEVAAPGAAFPGAFDTATADPLEPLVLEAQRVNFWSWARALERVREGRPLDSLERASLAVLLGRFTDALGETGP